METFTINYSANVKTGHIPVSMSNSGTCPDACPFKKNGCYASTGPLFAIWQALDRGFMARQGNKYDYGMTWKEFVSKVKELPRGIFWRHNQAGDLKGKNNKIDTKALKELVAANQGKAGFSYTHKPVLESQGKESQNNREAIKYANINGFTTNLSGNNLSHADELKALNIGPVVAVIPSDFKEEKGLTPAGNRFIVCPAQTKDNVTCASCQLCSKQRSIIVAFKAHGTRSKLVDTIIK